MNVNQLILGPPDGPIQKKYSTFVWLGEPGYAKYPEVHYAGQPNTAKTSAAMDALILSALQYPGAGLALVRDTRENLMNTTYKTLMARGKAVFDAGVATYISSRNTIEFTNGSYVMLFGLDTPGAEDALLGMEPFRAFIDQEEGISEELLDTLLTRLARQKPRHRETGELGYSYVKATANFQKGRGWIWRRTEPGSEEIRPDFLETTITGLSLGKEITAKRLLIKAHTDERDFGEDDQYREMVLLAGGTKNKFFTRDWAENSGLLFPEYKPEIHEVETIEELDGCIGYGGIDHGLGGDAHPAVGLFGAVNFEGRIGICREHVSRSTTTARQNALAMAALMADLVDRGVTAFHLKGDSSMWRRDSRDLGCVADDYAEVFYDLDFPVYFEPASKVKETHNFQRGNMSLTGLNRVKELFAARPGGKPRIQISRRYCKELVTMLSNLDSEKLQRDAAPLTDVFDALRYGFSSIPIKNEWELGREKPNPNKGRQALIYAYQ